MEKIEYNGTEFTFERVESINELSSELAMISTEDHETALKFWVPKYSTHILYYEQKSTGGRIYAFTKGE